MLVASPPFPNRSVNHALSGGPCVIVGRGSQYFLRNRKDVFRTFLYASRDYKIHRLICGGTPERDAIEQVDTIDRDRAAFVKKYLKLNWPDHHLYNAMFNTEMGEILCRGNARSLRPGGSWLVIKRVRLSRILI